MSDNRTNRSVYRRGADDGLWFGIYLSVVLLSSFCSLTVASALGWLSMIMAVSVPLVVYFCLKRSYRQDNYRSQFSMLWLHGICIFFFGGLIMALTAYVYMRFVNPSFYSDVFDMLLKVYEQSGVSADDPNYMMLAKINEAKMFPTAGESAMELLMSSVFTGSILSMLIALIVRATSRRTTPPPMQS